MQESPGDQIEPAVPMQREGEMIESKIAQTVIAELAPTGIVPSTLAGWISPSGQYFRIASAEGHVHTARQIVGSSGAWSKLESNGWVHLSDSGSADINRYFSLTKQQIDTLFDLAVLVPESQFGKKIMAAIAAAE